MSFDIVVHNSMYVYSEENRLKLMLDGGILISCLCCSQNSYLKKYLITVTIMYDLSPLIRRDPSPVVGRYGLVMLISVTENIYKHEPTS